MEELGKSGLRPGFCRSLCTWLQALCESLAVLQVRRFARFVLGEGIEKKQENFAEEIAAATGQS